MPPPNARSLGDSNPHGPPPSLPSPTPSIPNQDPASVNSRLGIGFGSPLLPVIPDGAPLPEKAPSSNAATAASAAGVRALTSQAVAFYFRAPVKAFFRTRVDYLAYARALHEHEVAPSSPPPSSPPPPPRQHGEEKTPSKLTQARGWLRARLSATTPAVLASAVRHYGWRVVPDQVLPPLVANVGVGAVLYTSYLQVLGRLHPESALATRRVYPPPAPVETFAAGFLAGAIQSLVAAPLDAVQARWDGTSTSVAGMTGSGNPRRPKSMWAFSAAKLREIGPRGIFAGWGLSFLKDSMGSAVFFSVFEYVKAQGYYNFVRWYYGSLNEDTIVLLAQKRPTSKDGRLDEGPGLLNPRMPAIIRPHYAIEPAFLLLAGMSASLAQQVILHPLSHVQAEHWERLEGLDAQARKMGREARLAETSSNSSMFKAYRDAYRITWTECAAEAQAAGLSMRRWLYRGFWWNTIRQVPSTSAGLIIFELVRRKYGFGGDQVRINRDGYDILLN
ncbi:mitochondrial carrier domain-containing protein [Chaetomidium leptoderma]|uniref:Mitochondrial carrier domain-containing protein n=1 Tax=Chaetomidium leptoderma TaxID=669021 RepID=A0AAN6VCS2_9PEZI|nr:mitochondrial carrier domain-containing protein [Chaetomidium leptoderma]